MLTLDLDVYVTGVFIFFAVLGAITTIVSLVSSERKGFASSSESLQERYHDHFMRFANYAFSLLLFYAATMTAMFLFNWARSIKSIERSASDDVGSVLSLAESMFSLFGFFLALMSAIGGLSAWWFAKKIHQTFEVEEKLTRDFKSFKEDWTRKLDEHDAEIKQNTQGHVDYVDKKHAAAVKIANEALIMACDLLLQNLPRVTFSQQIPVSILNLLRNLDSVFSSDGRQDLLSGDALYLKGARIWFARGVFHLGVGNGKDIENAAEMLRHALNASDDSSDIQLQEDIAVRLLQVNRQNSELRDQKEIDACFYRLRSNQVLFYWAKIISYVHEGIHSDSKRKSAFESAKRSAVKLHNLLRQIDDEHHDRLGTEITDTQYHAAAWYYVARGMWVDIFYRWEKSGITDTDHHTFEPVFNRVSANLMSILPSISDVATQAIYYASSAYLLIVGKHILGGDAAKLNVAQMMIDKAEKCCSSLKDDSQVQSLGRRRFLIYNDHLERLGTVDEFINYLNDLRWFAEESDHKRIARFHETWSRQ